MQPVKPHLGHLFKSNLFKRPCRRNGVATGSVSDGALMGGDRSLEFAKFLIWLAECGAAMRAAGPAKDVTTRHPLVKLMEGT